jgi:hypothetical protein
MSKNITASITLDSADFAHIETDLRRQADEIRAKIGSRTRSTRLDSRLETLERAANEIFRARVRASEF